jgi:hypothetical protein
MNIFSIMPDFLRDPEAFFRDIQEGRQVKAKVLTLGQASILFFMAYGFMVGLSKSPVQTLSSAGCSSGRVSGRNLSTKKWKPCRKQTNLRGGITSEVC